MNGDPNIRDGHQGDNINMRRMRGEGDYMETLGRMPGYEEFKENRERAQNEERGGIVNEVVVDSQEKSEEQIDPFWMKQPELLDEAKFMGAPLTANEFDQEGYKLVRGEDGKVQVWAPTPEYKEWLDSDSETRESVFKGARYEDMRDKEDRLRRERYARQGVVSRCADGMMYDFKFGAEHIREPNREGIISIIDSEANRCTQREKDEIRALKTLKNEVAGMSEAELKDYSNLIKKSFLEDTVIDHSFDPDNQELRDMMDEFKDDEKFKKQITRLAIVNAMTSPFKSMDSESKKQFEKRLDYFKVADNDPIDTLELMNTGIDDVDVPSVDDQRNFWFRRIGLNGNFVGGGWGGRISLSNYLIGADGWKEKANKAVADKIDDFAHTLLKQKNEDETELIASQNYMRDWDTLDDFRFFNSRNRVSVPATQSLLNIVTPQRLARELERYGITLLCQTDRANYYDGKYVGEDKYEPYVEIKEG